MNKVVLLLLFIWDILNESICVTSETTASGGSPICTKVTVLRCLTFIFRRLLLRRRLRDGAGLTASLEDRQEMHAQGVYPSSRSR